MTKSFSDALEEVIRERCAELGITRAELEERVREGILSPETPRLLQAIARTFRAARERCGLSQAELATRAGVDLGVVVRVESASNLPLETLRQLVLALGLSLADFFELVQAQPEWGGQ